MHKIAILDDYQHAAMEMADWQGLATSCEITVFDQPLRDHSTRQSALAPFDIVCLMRERTPFPAQLIEELPNLKLLVTTGAHNRTLDLQAAIRQGVIVCHTRSGDTEHPTAELTWALILAVARRLTWEERSIRANGWQSTLGTTLHGKTLGLLGFGRLGQRVGAIGQAFGMNLIAWSPNLTRERANEGGARLVSKNELLETSDVLSIHLVLSPSTSGIIGESDLRKMSAASILINTSRGPLIDEGALISALEAGQIGAAGLDVFDEEPLRVNHPLLSLGNVVLTPHLGFVTRETYRQFFIDTVENIEAYLEGAPIRLLRSDSRDG